MAIKFLKDPSRNVFFYIVAGEPMPLSKVTDETSTPTVWDTYKCDRFRYIQHIKNQHEKFFEKCHFLEGARNPRQFVDGPIKLQATFYMTSFVSRSKKKEDSETYEGKPPLGPHCDSPPIFSLYNFLDHALQGVVYKKDCTISSVEIKKKYSKTPRTEITITRL